jgi:glycosyltransferase involved in cell wall biosynthesis
MHDVTVLYGDVRTGFPSRNAIDSWLSANAPIPNLTFVYIPPTHGILWWERLHRVPGLWFTYYQAYALWQKQALKVAESLHRQQPFDLSHMLTLVSYRDPGFLWKLNVPFFWGPIGGSGCVPLSFLPSLAGEEYGRATTRDLLNRLQLRLAFRSRYAARKATLVWGASQDDLDLIRRRWTARGAHLLETGTTPANTGLRIRRRSTNLRLVWSGLHVARKALPLLLKSLNQLDGNASWTLSILGGGPCTNKWQSLADQLGLVGPQVRWLGYLPHKQAVNEILDADVLVHTSVKEGSTNVVMEALSLGRPVICHDIGGMSYAVNSTCGLKVPLISPEVSVKGFRDAISSLLISEDLLHKLSLGAQRRAQDLSWDNIVASISSAYVSSGHLMR